MRELPLGDPHFCRLRVALMEVHDGLPVRREARIGVQPRVADHHGTTERGNVDAVQVVPPPLLDDGVDAFRVRTPGVGTDGKRPALRRLDIRSDCPTIRPSDEYQPHAVRLEPNRKSTRLNSSHLVISYAVFCLKKKKAPATGTVIRPHVS